MKTITGTSRGVLTAAFVIAVLALVVTVEGQRLYTASGDLALHYDLANAISRNWIWPTLGKPINSGMAGYPPLAHYLAAIVGTPFGSALIGLNMVSVLCVFGSYLLLADSILAGSRAGSALALVLAATVLAYGRSQHAVIGFEVFWNFFYAQMVGAFVFLAFTAWLCRSPMDWRGRLLATAVVTVLCGWLYALAAVQVAVAYVCLEGVRAARAAWAARRLTLVMITPATAGVLILPPLVVFHPMFKNMVVAAGNDGGMDLMALNTLVPGLAVGLLLVCTLLGLFGRTDERWRRGSLFIATAGFATAIPALLQFAAKVLLHMGSNYAVKKYGFSVMTLLAFGLGAIGAMLVELRVRGAVPQRAGLVLSSLLAAAVTLKLAPFDPISLGQFVRYERAVQAVAADPRLPADVRGRVISRNVYYPWYLNHAASMVDLDFPAQASFDAATHPDWDFTEHELAPYAFVDNRDKAIRSRCIQSRPVLQDIVLVSTRCFIATSAELEPGSSLDMSRLARRPPYFSSGWSGKEAAGFWNDGKTASVVMHLEPGPAPAVLTFDVGAFIPAPDSVQHVQASIGGKSAGQWLFDAKTPGGLVAVALPATATGDTARIDFSFPDAVSPAERKISGDARRLAIFVRAMSLSGAKRLEPGETVDIAGQAGKPSAFLAGWSDKEARWIWNDGVHASMSILPAAGAGPVVLRFNGDGFIPRKGYVQRIVLSVHGHQVGQWRFDAASPAGERTVTIPREWLDSGQLNLDFAFPDATSPADHKLSGDTRKLAYLVRSFTLDDPARSAPGG